MADIKFVQDVDKTLSVLKSVATWLKETGKNPSKWWNPDNINRDFMLKHAEGDEFYVGLIDDKPAVAAILQWNDRNQSWESVEGRDKKEALYIHWLCVARDFAGQGLSNKMIDFANGLARKHHIKLLRLDTGEHESKLRAIYESAGFVARGIVDEEDRKTVLYELALE